VTARNIDGAVESFDLASLLLRAAAYYACLQAVGLAMAPAWARTLSAEERGHFGNVVRYFALAAAGLVLAHRFLDAARLAGEWSGILDGHVERLAWHSAAGASLLVTTAGLLLMTLNRDVALGIARVRPTLACVLVLGGFALTGHTTESGVPWMIRALVPVHLALLAFWLGGLAVLVRATRTLDERTIATRASEFSTAAIWLVPLIAVVGVSIAAALLPGLAALREPYGRGLAAKVCLYAALLALAALNRHALVPQLRSQQATALRRFLRALRTEQCLFAGALLVTAGITTIWGIGR